MMLDEPAEFVERAIVRFRAECPRSGEFVVSERRHNPDEGFGNALVAFSSADLKVRFVRDRGHVSAEVGSPHTEGWWSMELVTEVLAIPKPEPTLESSIAVLCSALPRICGWFSQDALPETRSRLERVTASRMARFT